MLHDNAYETSDAIDSVARRVALRTKAVLWWVAYFYPVILWAMIYGGWALTYVALGRPPGHGEHPGHDAVHTAVHAFGTLAGVLMLAGPVLVPMGMLWSVIRPFARRSSTDVWMFARIVCLCTYALMLVTVVSFLRYEPFGIMDWFWD